MQDTSKRSFKPFIVTFLVTLILFGATAVLLLSRAESADQNPEEIAIETTQPPRPTATSGPSQAADKDPNVLLIILDDIGLDYFPGFLEDQAFDKANMPVIEGLMQRAHVFNNLHTYAMCSPTRASLLTGLHGIENGVIDTGGGSYLDPSFKSIQEELKQQSKNEIATAVFGKWHILGREGGLDHPTFFGIDNYQGIIEGNHDDYSSWTKTTNGVQSPSTTYSTTEFTNDAIDWINTQEEQWFTWLAYTAPHTPLHLPPADLHTNESLSGSGQDIRANGPEYLKAMLESVDTEIGRLLDAINQEDKENTYVMIIGDNGSGGRTAQEPYASVGTKGSLHTGGINTPMIVIDPSNTERQEHNQLISTIDFFPTITDIFGYSTEQEMPGSSFLPLLSQDTEAYDEHEFVYSQNADAAMVSNGNHKIIRENGGSELFFDISADPFEQTALDSSNLSNSAQQDYTSLSTALDSYLQADY